MNIKIEVNKFGDKNVLVLSYNCDIYAKNDVQAKDLAKKFIEQIPEATN